MKLWMVVIMAGLSGVYTHAQEESSVDFPINGTMEFTGMLGNRSVLVELTNSEVGLNGRYKVLKQGKIIPLEGVIDPQHGYAIELEEGAREGNRPRPLWRAVYRHDSIVGKWQGVMGKKTYPIRLGRKKAQDPILNFKRMKEDTVVYSIPKDTSSTHFTYRYDYVRARGTSALAQWMNKKIQDAHRPMADRKEQSENYRESLRETEHPEYAFWNWDYDNEVHEYYQENGYLIFESSGYQYYGGAHGLSWIIYDTYDLQNQKKVELSDIMRVDSTQVKALLVQQFRKDYEVKEKESLKDFGLFENEIPLNRNFSFNDWGLTFTYNQYEIGPYVMGIMDVFIPWEELMPYLKPDFIKRMALPVED